MKLGLRPFSRAIGTFALASNLGCSNSPATSAANGDRDATGPAAPTSAVERAFAYIAAHPRELFVSDGTRFEPRAVIVDRDGREHVRLRRRYRGLRVLGGDTVIHLGGKAPPPSQTLRKPIDLDPSRAIDPQQAERSAGASLGWPTGADSSELVVYARGHGSQLAYELVRREGSSPPREEHAIVGGRDGALLDSWNAVATVMSDGTGLYAGAVKLRASGQDGAFTLEDAERDLSTVDANNGDGSQDQPVTSEDGHFGSADSSDRADASVDVHYGIETAWEYFASAHDRQGIDGDGGGLLARAHYGDTFANAFFDPSCGCINLGDGDPSSGFGPLTAIDVVAHELTHAITAASADLTYSGESGGLNESTSDIFGTMVERYADNPNEPPDYVIGELVRPPDGIRRMANPEQDGVSIGCWSQDAGSVEIHAQAGIGNHFFYLLAEGTTSDTHTCGTGASFNGIGATAAAEIWYRALTTYFTSDTDWSQARAATIQAATDLHGDGSDEVASVQAAWDAVTVP